MGLALHFDVCNFPYPKMPSFCFSYTHLVAGLMFRMMTCAVGCYASGRCQDNYIIRSLKVYKFCDALNRRITKKIFVSRRIQYKYFQEISSSKHLSSWFNHSFEKGKKWHHPKWFITLETSDRGAPTSCSYIDNVLLCDGGSLLCLTSLCTPRCLSECLDGHLKEFPVGKWELPHHPTHKL